eukprot:GHVT01019425.1.p1 GENE.GHVT01019425.1~~GHVT01019425.1.p1  ORF type:complete len:218 (-),score=26.22 GHVT01019425.1:144-764(-)
MATPVDAVARTAIEQQQSTFDQLSALLRGAAPTETLIPPSAAELQSRLVKRITSQACFQKALVPSESSTTPWHFQEAIDVTSDAKDVSERKLMSVTFTCFRYAYRTNNIPFTEDSHAEISTMWIVWQVSSRQDFLAPLPGFLVAPSSSYWHDFWTTLPNTVQNTAQRFRPSSLPFRGAPRGSSWTRGTPSRGAGRGGQRGGHNEAK